jgi:hypothetical protein
MLILGIVCIVLAVILATRLFLMGAQSDDVPVSSAPLDQANETYPRLRAVSALRDGDTGLDYRPPTLSGPAAKGFARDVVVGRDVVTRAERQWTQPMTRKEMN